jgi:ADP-heptose:LPS heptosyltransferase
MHIAAATGKPTLGIFVSTPPARYGYTDGLNAVIDARNGFGKDAFQELTTFVDGLDSPPST